MKITAEYFKEKTGQDPAQDDLERCNCPHAGEFMHEQCGWNFIKDRPVFEVGSELKTIAQLTK